MATSEPSDLKRKFGLPKRCNIIPEMQTCLEYASPAEARHGRCFNDVPSHLNCFGDLMPVNSTDDHDEFISRAFRKPRRVTITIPYATFLALERHSYEQGRSLSSLSAYLLECAVKKTF
jgi:hypothetical protein